MSELDEFIQKRMGIELDPVEAKLLRRSILASGLYIAGIEGFNTIAGVARRACELDREIARLTQEESSNK